MQKELDIDSLLGAGPSAPSNSASAAAHKPLRPPFGQVRTVCVCSVMLSCFYVLFCTAFCKMHKHHCFTNHYLSLFQTARAAPIPVRAPARALPPRPASSTTASADHSSSYAAHEDAGQDFGGDFSDSYTGDDRTEHLASGAYTPEVASPAAQMVIDDGTCHSSCINSFSRMYSPLIYPSFT